MLSISNVQGHTCVFIKVCIEIKQPHGVCGSKAKRTAKGWKDTQLGKEGNELPTNSCINRQQKQKPRLRKGDQVRRGLGDCKGLYYGPTASFTM